MSSTMSPEKRARLEAAGITVSHDVGDILGLTDADRKVVEFRTEVARKVRELRDGRGLTQAQLAAIIGVSQSRIPGIENGTASLDTIAAVIVALGGSLKLDIPPKRSASRAARPRGIAGQKKRHDAAPAAG